MWIYFLEVRDYRAQPMFKSDNILQFLFDIYVDDTSARFVVSS